MSRRDARGNGGRSEDRRRKVVHRPDERVVARAGRGRVIEQEARIDLIVRLIAPESVHSPFNIKKFLLVRIN